MNPDAGRPAADSMRSGWCLVAFRSELGAEPRALHIGGRRLAGVIVDGRVQVYSAVCPHRGADLVTQGRVTGAGLLCGFHRRLIRWPATGPGLCLTSVHVETIGELVFARLLEECDLDFGFAQELESVRGEFDGYGGVVRSVHAPPELVTQNAFDLDHFSPVHNVVRVVPRGLGTHEQGSPWVRAGFLVGRGASPGAGLVETPFHATAWSPGLVFSWIDIGGAAAVVVTGSTACADGRSTVRVGFLLPKQRSDQHVADVAQLTANTSKSLDQDCPIWEGVSPGVHADVEGDEAMRLFDRFCDRFRATVVAA